MTPRQCGNSILVYAMAGIGTVCLLVVLLVMMPVFYVLRLLFGARG